MTFVVGNRRSYHWRPPDTLFGTPLRAVLARGRKLGCFSSFPVPCLWSVTPVCLLQVYPRCWRRWPGQRHASPRGAGNVFSGTEAGMGTNSFCSFAALPGSPVISLTPVPLLMLPRTTPTPSSPLSPHTPCFCSLSQPHPGSALGPGACQHVVSPGCPPPPCSLPWREPLLC